MLNDPLLTRSGAGEYIPACLDSHAAAILCMRV